MEQSHTRKPWIIPNLLAQGVKVVKTVIEQMEPLGYSQTAQFAVRLALDEAMANAIRHGNNNDPTKHVTIEYHITEEQLQISICDEGDGFKPEQVPDPTLDENLERPCGRGVMLMNAYMTKVTFNDKGNCVTMIKRKDCPLPYVSEED